MKHLSLFVAITFIVAVSARAQLPSTSPARVGVSAQRLEVMHATIQRSVDEGEHAGVIALLARNGKIADFRTYGYRDLEKKLPMERNTICRVYSMSKIITSVAVLALLEDGRFNLDDPISKYLPELAEMKVMTNGTADAPVLFKARPITIKHLLTHTSGLTYDFFAATEVQKLYMRADLWNSSSLKEFTEKVSKLPLVHQPGDNYTYGINVDVLGALIERVSGKSFGDFLQERIFTPLQMKDTAFDVPAEKRARLAKTYKHGADGKLIEAEPLIGVHGERGRGIQSGGGGLFSTVDDYARFAQMLLNGGTLDGKRILGRKTIELMTANHLVTLPESAKIASRPQGFGLGVEVQLDLGRVSMPGSPGAFGWYGAATTYCRIDPKERTVAIVLAQHFPFNEHNLFAKWATGYYQALE